MTLVDVNLLVYATDAESPDHERAAAWLEGQLNAEHRVALPWESLLGFMRIATNPRASRNPMTPSQAWDVVMAWLSVPTAWTPMPTDQHAQVLGTLVAKYRLGAKLVPDGRLVALAIEHGLDIYSTDTDFARFSEIRWINPLAR